MACSGDSDCCHVAVAVVLWLLFCGRGCCPLAVAVVMWLWLLSRDCCSVGVDVAWSCGCWPVVVAT